MGTRFQLGDEHDKESDLTHYIIQVTEHRGHEYRVFYTDKVSVSSENHLLYYYGRHERIIDGQPFISTRFTKEAEIQKLRSILADFRPDIVWYEYNNTMRDGDDTLNPDDFSALKDEFGFKLVRRVGDLQYFTLRVGDDWCKTCDIIHSLLNPDSILKHNYIEKFYFLPVSIVGNQDYTQKIIDFGFLGSDSRDRSAYLLGIEEFISNCVIELNNSGFSKDKKEVHEYLNFMEKLKMTFNSGYRGCINNINDMHEYYILTGRVIESLVNQTLLFEDYGYQLQNYLAEYIDYIPVNNQSELIIWVQFMIKYPEWCDRIRKHGHWTYTKHYSAHNFWSGLEARLGFV